MIVLIRAEASADQRAAIAQALTSGGARSPLHSVHAAVGDVFVVAPPLPAGRVRALPRFLASSE